MHGYFFPSKHGAFLQKVATALLQKVFTNNYALVFCITQAMIGRNITAWKRKKCPDSIYLAAKRSFWCFALKMDNFVLKV